MYPTAGEIKIKEIAEKIQTILESVEKYLKIGENYYLYKINLKFLKQILD